MTPEQAAAVVVRINATWPPRQPQTAAEATEWLKFLRIYDTEISSRALDTLRGQLGWRPSMADFRAAYKVAAADLPEDRPALPAGDQQGPDLVDLYGSSQNDWVYCYLCDMAISLEERSTELHYRSGKGLRHKRCPKVGSVPIMPPVQRMERAEKQLGRPQQTRGRYGADESEVA